MRISIEPCFCDLLNLFIRIQRLCLTRGKLSQLQLVLFSGRGIFRFPSTTETMEEDVDISTGIFVFKVIYQCHKEYMLICWKAWRACFLFNPYYQPGHKIACRTVTMSKHTRIIFQPAFIQLLQNHRLDSPRNPLIRNLSYESFYELTNTRKEADDASPNARRSSTFGPYFHPNPIIFILLFLSTLSSLRPLNVLTHGVTRGNQ